MIALFGGCYGPTVPSGVLCSATETCPDEQFCRKGRCVVDEEVPLDAPDLDATEIDAPIDGAVDPWSQIAGLVARYPMDGDPRLVNMIVCSDPSYSATCSGVACPTAVVGTHGGAHAFDGSQYATVPTGTLVGATPFTVAIWAYTEASPNPFRMMLGKPLDATTNANVYALGMASGRIGFETTDGLAFRTVFAPPGFNPIGVWHHYASTWDGTTKHLFLDGVDASSASATLVDSTLSIVIGADVDSGVVANHWVGRLDELRIYGRALAAGEVALLAQPNP